MRLGKYPERTQAFMKMQSLYSISIGGCPAVLDLNLLIEKLNSLPDDQARTFLAFRMACEILHFQFPFDFRKRFERPLETHDVFKLVNAYGYGNCKQITMFLQFLLVHAGVSCRVLSLNDREKKWNHFVLESFYDETWHLFDPDLKVYFFDAEGKVVSASDVANGNFTGISGELSCKTWQVFHPQLNEESFHEIYFSLYDEIETFDMVDDRYVWKEEFMAHYGLSQWYGSQQPLCWVPEPIRVLEVSSGWGIVDGERKASDSSMGFPNLVFEFWMKDQQFTLNQFPFPILEIKLGTGSGTGKIKGTLHIRGKSFDFESGCQEGLLGVVLEKKPDSACLPVYSFDLRTERPVETIAITVQASVCRAALFQIIEEESRFSP